MAVNGRFKSPTRLLPSGETVGDAMRRLYALGSYPRLEAMREIKCLEREGIFLADAEDEVLGRRYSPADFPCPVRVPRSRSAAFRPTISWQVGRADVESAKTDFDWLVSALKVKVPADCGTPTQRAMLAELRADVGLRGSFHRLILKRMFADEFEEVPLAKQSLADFLSSCRAEKSA